MKAKLIILIVFLISGIWSFGQIDNKFIRTSDITLKGLTGTGLKTLAVNNSGEVVLDSIRLALNDSNITYPTLPYLNANYAKLSDIEAAASGFQIKDSVSCASTANLDLNGAETVDGIATVTGMRVLVKNQTDSIQNGCYQANNSGTWTRSTDSDLWTELIGASYLVNRGSTQQYYSYVCGVASGGTVGANKIWFNISSKSEAIVAGAGLIRAGNQIYVDPDNSTIEINSNKLRVKDGGISNAKVGTGIDAVKIGNGTITNTEFQQLNGINTVKTIQGQFDSVYTKYNAAAKGISVAPSSTTMSITLDDFANNTSDYIVLLPTSSQFSGLFTPPYKSKIDGIESLAEKNVQADNNTTDPNLDSYIKNKPDLTIYRQKSDTVALNGTATNYDLTSYYTKSQSDAKYPVDSVFIRHDSLFWIQDGVTKYGGGGGIGNVPELGDFYQGGYVFYIDPSNSWGLCASASYVNTTLVPWSLTNTNISTSTSVGTGQTNTSAIIANQGAGSYGAQVCNDLVLAGYSNWYLPSKDELYLIYTVLKVDKGINYPSTVYLSSSQNGSSTTTDWVLYDMAGSGMSNDTKATPRSVIAVRTWYIGSDQAVPSGADGDILYSDNGSWTPLKIGSENQVLKVSSGLPAWGSGSGSGLTSVGLTMPSMFTVSNSPLTSNGTLDVSLDAVGASLPLISPVGGGVPTFRALVDADIPDVHTNTGYALLSGATFTGKVTLPANTTTAMFRLTQASANPTSLNNGDMWCTPSGFFGRANGNTISLGGSGTSGVTTFSQTAATGLFNSGTTSNPFIKVGFDSLTTVTADLNDVIAISDVSSSSTATSPKTLYKYTLNQLKTLIGSTFNLVVKSDDNTPTVSNVDTLNIVGMTVEDNGNGKVTITGGTGTGGDEPFQTLAETGTINWSWLTSKNAKILDVDGNITLNFSNAMVDMDGKDGYLEIKTDPTTSYILTFQAGCWFTNGHTKAFTLEPATKYVFYLKCNGTEINIDYATYTIAN